MPIALNDPQELLQWQRRIHDYALRQLRNEADAADVTQETLLALYKDIATVRDPKKVRAWVYRVTLNKILNFRRANQREARRLSKLEPAKGPEATVEIVTRLGTMAKVRHAVSDLPEDLRHIMILRFFHDLTQEEIAEILGLSRSAIRRRLDRALETLRQNCQSLDQPLSLHVLEASLIGSSLYSIHGPATKAATSLGLAQTVTLGALTMKKSLLAALASVAMIAGTAVIVNAQAQASHTRKAQLLTKQLTDQSRKLESLSTEINRLKQTNRRQSTELKRAQSTNQSLLQKLNDAQRSSQGTNQPKASDSTSIIASNEARRNKKHSKPRSSFQFGLPSDCAALQTANWNQLGDAIYKFQSLLPRYAQSQLTGKNMSAEDKLAFEQTNIPLALFAMRLSQELPKATPSDAFNHPAVVASLIAATLESANDPLSEQQFDSINSLGKSWELNRQAIIANRNDSTLALERVYQEVQLKIGFVNSLSTLLTDSQKQIVFNPETQGRMGLDLLSPGLIYKTSHLRATASTLDKVRDKCARKLVELIGIASNASVQPYEYFTERWIKSSPFCLSAHKTNDREILFPTIENLQKCAAAQIQAMHNLIDGHNLTDEQRQELKSTTTLILPQWLETPPKPTNPRENQ